MRQGKMLLMGTVLAAALWGSNAFSAEGAEKSLTLLTGGACPSTVVQAPQPLWLTSPGCYEMSDCVDDNSCWGLCPTATSAACVNNVCQFTLPGGGGSGPGGGACPEQRDCADDSHCVYFGGIYGTCVNNLCIC